MHSLLASYTQQRVLIDCNSFFASCEVLRDPSLRGKPVCVGKQGNIVIAATYEARAYGVRTGTPYWEAQKMLPKGAIFLEGDMRRYGEVSKRLMNYLESRFVSVYPASIDEAFLHLTGSCIAPACRESRCRELKDAIRQHLGIPVSLGMSVTKILAKLCAEQRKPLGEYAAETPQKVQQLLYTVSLEDIPFIGAASAEKLLPFCSNALEFAQLSSEHVKALLGTHGLKIRYELNGISLTVRSLGGMPKSIGRSRSFNPCFTTDRNILRAYVLQNFEKARRELREKTLQTRLVSVSLKTRSFRKWKLKYRLPQPTDQYEPLFQEVKKLFERLHQPGVLMRTTGVRFTELSSGRYTQQGLFNSEHETHATALDETLYSLQKTMGRGVVTKASQVVGKKKMKKKSITSLSVQ